MLNPSPWRSLILRFPQCFPWWLVWESRRNRLLEDYRPELRNAQDVHELRHVQAGLEHELQMLDQEVDVQQTAKLRKKAHRLSVPLPPRTKEDGDQYWHEAPFFGEWVLTQAGIKVMRDGIRAETKARHEERTRWIAYVSAVTTCLALVTAVLALLR
ncbi:hypothetical protein [Xenophilus sp.]|uniref:hypothetical protein n=1 Tax=Xenophilus sp. TaxID=1873499 RepID=UPI0037DCE984